MSPISSAPSRPLSDPTEPPGPQRAEGGGLDWEAVLVRAAMLVGLLYIFLLGLDMMGLSFKLFGKGFAEQLVTRTANPFVGLFVGIFATSLVQSSSTTTSMIVGLVAAGALSIEGAVPMIMGANIGTSVTNTLVSLGHVTRPEEFRRAFAGATLHDFFNWLAVLILLPIEILFHPLARGAEALEGVLEGVGGTRMFDPLRAIVRPAAEAASELLGKSGPLTLLVGVTLLFFALRFLVALLRSILSGRAEQVLHRTLFRSAPIAILAGAAITMMVQSSSITTSTIIPLVGAGVVTLQQLFPFTIGANLGTTITAILAALATGSPAAITVALSHLLFNIAGMIVLYVIPVLRPLPIFLAQTMGNLGARNRGLAAVYIVAMFYGFPLLLLLLTGTLNGPTTTPADPQVIESNMPELAEPLSATDKGAEER